MVRFWAALSLLFLASGLVSIWAWMEVIEWLGNAGHGAACKWAALGLLVSFVGGLTGFKWASDRMIAAERRDEYVFDPRGTNPTGDEVKAMAAQAGLRYLGERELKPGDEPMTPYPDNYVPGGPRRDF